MSEIAASLTSPREHPPANASTRSCRTNLAAATTQMNRGRHKPGHDLRERPARLTGIRASGAHQAQCRGKADR